MQNRASRPAATVQTSVYRYWQRQRKGRDEALTDRLLVTRAGTRSAEPLRLHPARVGDEQGAVVSDEDALELDRGLRVLVLAGVGDDRLGNGLTDGVDLAGVATAGDADAHVDARERVRPGLRLFQHEDRLVELQSTGRQRALWKDARRTEGSQARRGAEAGR